MTSYLFGWHSVQAHVSLLEIRLHFLAKIIQVLPDPLCAVSLHGGLPVGCELRIRVQDHVVKVAGHCEVVDSQLITTEKLEARFLAEAHREILEVLGEMRVHYLPEQHLLTFASCEIYCLVQILELEVPLKVLGNGLAAVDQQWLLGHHFEHVPDVVQNSTVLVYFGAVHQLEHRDLPVLNHALTLQVPILVNIQPHVRVLALGLVQCHADRLSQTITVQVVKLFGRLSLGYPDLLCCRSILLRVHRSFLSLLYLLLHWWKID